MRPQSDFAGVAELACSGQVWTCRSSLQRRRQTWISNVAPVATSAMPVEEPQRRHDHVCTAMQPGSENVRTCTVMPRAYATGAGRHLLS
jgi:hypothetical protein